MLARDIGRRRRKRNRYTGKIIKNKEHTMLKIKRLLALLVLTAASAGCGQAWGMDKKVESLYPGLELEKENDEFKFYNPTASIQNNNYDNGNPEAGSMYPILNDNKIINKAEKRQNKPRVVFSFFKKPKSNEADSVMVLLKKNKNTSYTLPTDGDLDVLKVIINQFIIRTIDATTYLAKPLEEHMLFEDFLWVEFASHTQEENNFAPNWSRVANLLNNQQECLTIGSAWDALGKGIGGTNKNENNLEQESKIEKYEKIEKNEKVKEESVNKDALILEIAPESDGEIKINAVLVENSATIVDDFGVKETLFDSIYTTGAGNTKLNGLQKHPFATAWGQEGEVKSYLIAFKKNSWEDGLAVFENRFISGNTLLSDILVDHENPLVDHENQPKENEDVAPQQSSYFSNIFSRVGSVFGYKNDK